LRVLEYGVAEKGVVSGAIVFIPVLSCIGLFRVPLQLFEKRLDRFIMMLVPLGLEHLDDVPVSVPLPHAGSPVTALVPKKLLIASCEEAMDPLSTSFPVEVTGDLGGCFGLAYYTTRPPWEEYDG
jgi:hypothetical protein